MTGLQRSTTVAATALAVAMAGISLAPDRAAAQLGNPVPQSIGLGGNYTALARGFGAVSWNPAGLGMPGNPGMSLSFLPMALNAGMEPITPADLALYDGEIIPHDTKREWLELIQAEGGESGTFGTDLTYLGLSIGRFAFQASSSVRARVNVAPDVAEVFFFGNAGLTGDPRDYTLEGSRFDVAGTTTFAASTAVPLALRLGPLPDQHVSVGVTVKYTIGNFLLMGQEDGSIVRQDPLEVDFRFPMIHSIAPAEGEDFTAEHLNNGSGFGVDVGAAWQGGIFSGGVVVQNLVSTFEWDRSALQYRAGTATWTADTSYTSFEELPAEQAPAELMAMIDELYTFSPVLAAGAAARLMPFLTVTGDVRHALADNLSVAARNHVGVGAELTIVPMLPLRAGVSLISGGYQLSGGLGLRLGPANLSFAAAARQSELGEDAIMALGLSFGLR